MQRRTLILYALCFSTLAGCRSQGIPTPSPTSQGINPATLADPIAQADSFRLVNWGSLYDIGEQIKALRRPPVLPPKRTMLVLSGGGMYGAFTAGILVGWSTLGTRPNFDVVTGVSTGALIAGLVFVGPAYDAELQRLYTTITADDIYKRRRILRSLLTDAIADSTPLANIIERMTTPEYMQRVVEEHAKGRRYFVGTTDIEARRPVIWDMGAIATKKTPESVDLFRKVLLASAAIPGFFPPVKIPVEIDGIKYEERHVDGGVTSSLFVRPPWVPIEMRDDPYYTSLYDADLYLIVAGKLYADAQVVRPYTLNIASSSITSLIYSQSRDELFRMYTSSVLIGMNYNLASLPEDFQVSPVSTDFNPVEMSRLFEEGVRQIRSGVSWRKTPPGVEKGERTPLRAGNPLIRMTTGSPNPLISPTTLPRFPLPGVGERNLPLNTPIIK